MRPNPKQIVAKGYDEIAEDYLGRFSCSAVREAWLNKLIAALPKDARVLDLGCGAGVPVAKKLSDLGHQVTGIDGSARQVQLARTYVPDATFLHADMTAVNLRAAFFDGVAAFYSTTHVPAAEQGVLLEQVSAWLKPGGVFVGSFGTGAAHDWTGKWLGTEMFFSHNDDATSLALLQQANLQVVCAKVVAQDNEDARFMWVVAHKPH